GHWQPHVPSADAPQQAAFSDGSQHVSCSAGAQHDATASARASSRTGAGRGNATANGDGATSGAVPHEPFSPDQQTPVSGSSSRTSRAAAQSPANAAATERTCS